MPYFCERWSSTAVAFIKVWTSENERHCSNKVDKTTSEFKASCAVQPKCVITASVSTQERVQLLTCILVPCPIVLARCLCLSAQSANSRRISPGVCLPPQWTRPHVYTYPPHEGSRVKVCQRPFTHIDAPQPRMLVLATLTFASAQLTCLVSL